MNHYNNDPKWLTARFNSTCVKCKNTIKKGTEIFYYPKTKAVFCEACAEIESKSFDAIVQDEDFYNSQF